MSWIVPRRLAPVVVVLALLLMTLMYLQHRWIAELSDAERLRMRRGLEVAAQRLSGEVNHELRRALVTFHPDPRVPREARRAQLAQQLRGWRQGGTAPELLQDILIASRAAGVLELERLDERGTWTRAPWPPELAELRRHLEAHEAMPAPPAVHLIAAPALALVMPLEWPPAPGSGEPGVVIVRLDRARLTDAILPRLVDAWFGAAGGDALIAVMAPDGPVFLSDPSVPASRYLPGDVVLPFFDVGPLAGPPWRLVVTPRAGSLDAVVARVRNRNMAISTGVLFLLAGAVAMLALAARRAHRLARQQMEFVAGVTHELNTPITAMRSAAQNLADGVVHDPAQVRRYGTLIEREGARLSSLVAKALEGAGIHAGRQRAYHPEPLVLAEIVDEVLAGHQFAVQERGVEVERDVPVELPAVLADRRGLVLVVQNLVDNALKHAADGRWIGVHAAADEGRRTVTLMVDDRGPGVADEDRPYLFEPFYRGRKGGGPSVPGGGIGLGLVREVIEALGGKVSVGPGPGGRGARFAVQLPAATGTSTGTSTSTGTGTGSGA